MNFEEWWEHKCNDGYSDSEKLARHAWEDSTNAERIMCAAIAERVCREHADPKAGYAAAEAIRKRPNM